MSCAVYCTSYILSNNCSTSEANAAALLTLLFGICAHNSIACVFVSFFVSFISIVVLCGKCVQGSCQCNSHLH
jgi:hypothetical protein